jgi:hypothetical protein
MPSNTYLRMKTHKRRVKRSSPICVGLRVSYILPTRPTFTTYR